MMVILTLSRSVSPASNYVDLYEQLDDGQFVKVEPSPFKDMLTTPYCNPAVVDWNDDGLLDVLLATTNTNSGFSGVKYYERQPLGHFVEKSGDEKSFSEHPKHKWLWTFERC